MSRVPVSCCTMRAGHPVSARDLWADANQRTEMLARLEDKGFAVFVLGTTEVEWDSVVGKLSLALGKTADAARANKGDA